jgi:lysophospholipase L1-like esterase
VTAAAVVLVVAAWPHRSTWPAGGSGDEAPNVEVARADPAMLLAPRMSGAQQIHQSSDAQRILQSDGGRILQQEAPLVRDITNPPDGKVTVGCLGDSNTDPDFAPNGQSWCEQLKGLFTKDNWITVNKGLGGSTEVRSSRTAFTQLPDALKAGNLDAVVLAYGTNALWYGFKVAEIMQAYRELKKLAGPVPVFIALTPLRYDLPDTAPARERTTMNAQIMELNRQLLADKTFAGVFGFTPDVVETEDYRSDRLHLNAKGHAKRAAAARVAMER